MAARKQVKCLRKINVLVKYLITFQEKKTVLISTGTHWQQEPPYRQIFAPISLKKLNSKHLEMISELEFIFVACVTEETLPTS